MDYNVILEIKKKKEKDFLRNIKVEFILSGKGQLKFNQSGLVLNNISVWILWNWIPSPSKLRADYWSVSKHNPKEKIE